MGGGGYFYGIVLVKYARNHIKGIFYHLASLLCFVSAYTQPFYANIPIFYLLYVCAFSELVPHIVI